MGQIQGRFLHLEKDNNSAADFNGLASFGYQASAWKITGFALKSGGTMFSFWENPADLIHRFSSRNPALFLLVDTAKIAAGDKYDLYKTSDHFGSMARHPQWVG